MTKVVAISALVMLLGVGGSAAIYAAEEQPASAFVALKFEGACDDKNNRLWLTNSHTYKTIVATVRWRAAGGKDLQEDFYPSPNTVREIGCAAEAEILTSAFADF